MTDMIGWGKRERVRVAKAWLGFYLGECMRSCFHPYHP